MYPPLRNSPVAVLQTAIDADDLVLVLNTGGAAYALNAAPNRVVLLASQEDEHAETCLSASISGDTVTLSARGTNAKAWPAGTLVCRPPCAEDQEDLQHNIGDHETRIVALEEGGGSGGTSDIITGTAAEALALHDVVNLDYGGWKKAISDLSSNADGLKAICLQDLAEGATGEFLLRGLVTSPRYTMFGTPGMLVVVSPTTPGNISWTDGDRIQNVIGFALGNNSNTILFDPRVEDEGDANELKLILGWETAGEAIAVNDVVRYDPNDGWWVKAKADTLANCSGLLGIAVTAAAAENDDLQIFVNGLLENGTQLYLDGGTAVYVSAATAGVMTDTPPAIRRRVGYASSGSRDYLINPSPEPEVPLAFASLSADTTLTGSHPRIVLVDTTAEDIAITLPAASLCSGQTFVLKKTAPAATTYGCQFAAAGTDTIDGAATTPLLTAQYGTVRIVSDGTAWHII